MSVEKWKILQVAGRILKYAQLSALSDKFGYGYVSPPPEDPEQGDEPTQQRVRFMQWFGFRSRPVVEGGEAIVGAPRGGTTNAVALAADHLGYGPTDLKEGESAVYSKAGAVVRLDDPGNVKIDPKPNQDTLVNGGGVNVAVVGSEVDCGSLSVTMGMSGVATILWTPPGSVVSQVIATFPATTPITGKITNGSPHFKAPAP